MDSGKVALKEFYNEFNPPRYVFKTVRALLDSVPSEYLRGLDCVVLTNQSGHPRRYRLGKLNSRKRRVPQSRVRGLYHGAQRGNRAWIELYVDNIAPPPRYGWFPPFRDSIFGKVLFHEIGHHAHATVAPEHREKEDVADSWAKTLIQKFMHRKYWFLIPLVPLLRVWVRILRR